MVTLSFGRITVFTKTAMTSVFQTEECYKSARGSLKPELLPECLGELYVLTASMFFLEMEKRGVYRHGLMSVPGPHLHVENTSKGAQRLMGN